MPPAPVEGPILRGGYPVWWASSDGVEVRFVGRGPGGSRAEILGRVEGAGAPPVAEAKQVHSATVLPAREGLSGRGDALWTARPDLALSVITADCVPVLLASRETDCRLAAVHAGWRGIVAGVVERAVAALEASPSRLLAWIGPPIGACCYEVSEEVADQVAAASDPSVAIPGHRTRAGRPHLDLAGAVRHQLVRAGVPEPRVLLRCTRCDAERLWSYRREGKGVGRNVTFIWRKETP